MITLSAFNFDKEINFKIFENTLERSDFILGKSVEEFETKFADYNNAPACVSTANCTDSLRLCLQAHGIGVDDTVAVPSFTWLSTAEVVKQLGAKCLFIDINESLTIDTEDLQQKLKLHPETKALIFVDLFGNVADIDYIKQIAKETDTKIIQDSAQSTGAFYKKQPLYRGHPICFSFYPTKNLGCWGDAGAVVCDQEFASIIKSLRNHGQGSEKFISRSVGWNSRMDSLQADVLLNKLPFLDQWNARRREIAEYYKQSITIDCWFQKINLDCTPVYHQYTIITDKAEKIQNQLSEKNIQSRIYYKTPIHKLELYNNGQTLQMTESISGRNICIPVHQYLTDAQVDYIVESVNGT